MKREPLEEDCVLLDSIPAFGTLEKFKKLFQTINRLFDGNTLQTVDDALQYRKYSDYRRIIISVEEVDSALGKSKCDKKHLDMI